MSLRARALLLSIALAMPAAAGAKTLLIMDSEGSDYIGQGELRTFDPGDGLFDGTVSYGGASIGFDGSEFWTLNFAAPGDVPLAPGLYEGAVGLTHGPTETLLAIYGDGRACDSTGRFQVHEITYGMGGLIDTFAADFVQRCDSSYGRLIGAIRYNASDSLPDVVDVDGDTRADIADNCPGTANANQNDGDFDDQGDACDASLEASFVLFDSEEGDYIGQGERQVWNAGNGIVRARIQSGRLTFDVVGGQEYSLRFGEVGGGPPGVGVYEGAVGLSNGPTEALLAVSGDGRACDSTGRFEVFEAEYSGDEVIRFSADFEQRCDSGEAALNGVVRWRSAFRPATNDLDGDGYLTAEDNCPGAPNPAQFDTDGDGRGDGCGLGPAAQKCVNDFNKSTAAVVKAQNVSNLACLKNAQKGATDKLGVPATAQDCLSNDVGAKVAAGLAKLAAKDGKSCAVEPDFGRSDAAAAGEAARQASRNLMGDLFGATLDTAIVLTSADPVGAKCREEVAKRTHGAVDALWKLTLKQKKALLLGKKVLTATNGDTLAEGLVAFLASDPKGAVSKPFAALSAASAKSCTGVPDLAASFPGCAPADLPALNACAERSARCRFCQVLAVADGLETLDCDLFDNGTADLSCQQTP
jgi:hypothetical protein